MKWKHEKTNKGRRLSRDSPQGQGFTNSSIKKTPEMALAFSNVEITGEFCQRNFSGAMEL